MERIPKTPKKNKALILVAPILVHGVYDLILFITDVTPAISGILMIVFLVFCHKIWKYGSNRIKEHLLRDSIGEGNEQLQHEYQQNIDNKHHEYKI